MHACYFLLQMSMGFMSNVKVIHKIVQKCHYLIYCWLFLNFDSFDWSNIVMFHMFQVPSSVCKHKESWKGTSWRNAGMVITMMKTMMKTSTRTIATIHPTRTVVPVMIVMTYRQKVEQLHLAGISSQIQNWKHGLKSEQWLVKMAKDL